MSSTRAEDLAARFEAKREEFRHAWCQPGDDAVRRFVVRFEDEEKGVAVFDNEPEAREYFERAMAGGWNCYLLAALPRVPETRDMARAGAAGGAGETEQKTERQSEAPIYEAFARFVGNADERASDFRMFATGYYAALQTRRT